MRVHTACAHASARHQLIVRVLGVEARSDAGLKYLITRVARLRLTLIHNVLLELERVAVVPAVSVRILLQWDLLVLLPTVAHALVRLPVCLVSLLHLLPQRFLVRIAFHVVVK